jgi:hypothetical protein
MGTTPTIDKTLFYDIINAKTPNLQGTGAL